MYNLKMLCTFQFDELNLIQYNTVYRSLLNYKCKT